MQQVWEDEILTKETKRNVFEGLLESYMYSADVVIDEISTDGVADRLNLGNIIASTRYRYDAALPDDLPTIPQAVGEYIEDAKHGHKGLGFVMTYGIHAMTNNRITFEVWMTGADNYDDMINHEDAFARAWVLEAWCVKETGEIVKLEAKK